MLDLDLTGTNPVNRLGLPVGVKGLTTALVGEVITSPYGLFYPSVTLIDKASGLPLTEGEDYTLGPYDKTFYIETNQLGYTSLVLLNVELSGTLQLFANYVGGKYQTISSVVLPEILDKALVTRRNVTWDDFINLPTEDNPTEHTHSLSGFNSGYQNVAQALWRLLNNKKTVGTAFIENVAVDALSKFQPSYDEALTTKSKTVSLAVRELWDNLVVLTDDDGDDIKVTAILESGPAPLIATTESQYFLVGGINGEDLTLTGQWDDGTSSKVVPFGSMVVYSENTFKIIDGGYSDKLLSGQKGFYGSAQGIMGIHLNLLAQASKPAGEKTNHIITDDIASGFGWSGNEWGRYYLSNHSNPIRESFNITARWNGDALESTVAVPVGTMLQYTAENGVTITDAPMPFIYHSRARAVRYIDDTYYLPDLIASFEDKTKGDYVTGDIVVMVRGTQITDGTLIPLNGQLLSTNDYGDLFGLFGYTYGQGNNGELFALPNSPLGTVCKRTEVESTPITSRPQYLSNNGYSGYVNITGDTLTLQRMALSDRTMQVAINEDVAVFAGGLSPIGVGLNGTTAYLTGTINGTRSIWKLTNTNGTSSGFIEITQIQSGDQVIYDAYWDKLYIITSSELLRVDGNQKVFVGGTILSDTLVSVAFDPWLEYVYLLSATKVHKLNLNTGGLLSVNGDYTHLTYHWLTNNLLAVKAHEHGHLLDPVQLSVIGDTDAIPTAYDTNEFRLVNLTDSDTLYLSSLDEEPFYNYYIKG